MQKKILFFLLLPLLALTGLIQAETQIQTESIPANPHKTTSNSTTFWDDDVPSTDSDGHFVQELIHMLLTLGAIVFIMLGAGWILKKMMSQRMTQANSNSDIKVLERRSLGAKSAVYILEIHGRTIIVGESHTGLHALGEIPLEKKPSFNEIYEEKTSKP